MKVPRVVVAHNPAGPGDDPATADVLDQVGLVEEGLAALGLPWRRAAVAPDRPWEALIGERDALVFNLVEAPPGAPHVHSANAAVLELLGVPFTGSPAAAMWLSTDKIATRVLLADAGLPVAPGGRLDPDRPEVLDRVPPPWILKPACEDASVGLEGNPVCASREAALARAADLARRFPGQAVLAEAFLPGRELNVSLLADGRGIAVLPVAEMTFVDFPPELPPVLGYDAKWRTDTFLYTHTLRRFPEEEPLLARIREIARAAWEVCGLAGYARIDLRLDAAGEPRVLEVNANPCLAPDAGFMAAARQAGLGAREVVERILDAAVRAHRGRPAAVPARPERRSPAATALRIRDGIGPADRAPVEELIRATGFFHQEEVGVALELVDDSLGGGDHYRFLVGEVDGEVAGYACWGPIPGTAASADLYWIVVAPRFQGQGVGSALLAGAEERIAGEGRSRVYVETSTREQYAPTRAFYLACGYELAAELADFYAPGDGKAMFLKVL